MADTFTFEDNVSLSVFAQLDTMLTVVDCNVFFEKLDNIRKLAERKEALAEEEDMRSICSLMAKQVEFVNVVVLNWCDLVIEQQLKKVEGAIGCLNSEVKIKRTIRLKIDSEKVLGTALFDFEKALQPPQWIKTMRGQADARI